MSEIRIFSPLETDMLLAREDECLYTSDMNLPYEIIYIYFKR